MYKTNKHSVVGSHGGVDDLLEVDRERYLVPASLVHGQGASPSRVTPRGGGKVHGGRVAAANGRNRVPRL